jgi:hypothetical protein
MSIQNSSPTGAFCCKAIYPLKICLPQAGQSSLLQRECEYKSLFSFSSMSRSLDCNSSRMARSSGSIRAPTLTLSLPANLLVSLPMRLTEVTSESFVYDYIRQLKPGNSDWAPLSGFLNVTQIGTKVDRRRCQAKPGFVLYGWHICSTSEGVICTHRPEVAQHCTSIR